MKDMLNNLQVDLSNNVWIDWRMLFDVFYTGVTLLIISVLSLFEE